MGSGQNGLLILAGKSLRHDLFLVNLRCFPAFTIFFFPYNSAIQLKLVIQLTNLSLQSTFLFGCEETRQARSLGLLMGLYHSAFSGCGPEGSHQVPYLDRYQEGMRENWSRW